MNPCLFDGSVRGCGQCADAVELALVEGVSGVVGGGGGGPQRAEGQHWCWVGHGLGRREQDRQRVVVAQGDAQGPAAQERGLGAEPGVLGKPGNAVGELADPLRMPRVHGGLRRRQQPLGVPRRIGGQFGGAFQCRCRGGVSASGAGAFGGLGQGVGHLLVRSERGSGQVPGPAVGFVRQRGGQRQVRLASFGERGSLEDGGAHQRVPEQHLPALDPYQACLLGGEQRLRRVEVGGGEQDVRQSGGACGGDEQQGAPRLRGKRGQVGGEEAFQTAGERKGPAVGGGAAVPGERAAQLDQGQRVARGQLEDLGARPALRREGLGVQQPDGRRAFQRADDQMGEVAVEACRNRLLPRGEQQHGPLGVEAAREEGQEVERAEVQPLGVVHEQQQRLPGGGIGEQGQRAQAQRQWIHRLCAVRVAEAERGAQRVALPLRQLVHGPQQGAQQLVRPRQTQAGLALAAPYAERPQTARRGLDGGPLDQGALARARLAGEHQDLRALAVRGVEEPGQTGQLPIPAHDLRTGLGLGRGVHRGPRLCRLILWGGFCQPDGVAIDDWSSDRCAPPPEP